MKGTRTNFSRARGRRGISAVYAMIALTAMAGLCSLGVEMGRVQLVKTELMRAADAASRAAASQLSNGITTTQNTAVTWGGYNTADGSAVVIDATNDVDFGTWNSGTKTFTVLTGAARSSANAVRVWARRTSARGTAVPLVWGRIVGIDTFDTSASSISQYVAGSSNYGIIGKSSLTLKTNTVTTDSYDASAGAYSAGSATQYGFVGSNGTVTLNGTITAKKDLYMRAGQTLNTTGSCIYGTRVSLAGSLTFPTPSAGSYATTNSNGSVGLPATGANASFSSGTFTAAGGTYYLDSFNMTGGVVTFTGATTIYMNGPLSITGGSISTLSNLPQNLVFKTVIASTVSISGISSLYADIQAPSSTVTITAVPNIYGRWIGNTLTVNGTTALHVDTSLPAISGASTVTAGASAPKITYVK